MEESSKYIMSLDVGTTNVRCFIFNEQCQVIHAITEMLQLLNPQPGYFEIEPEYLWQTIVKIMQDTVSGAKLKPGQINCLALSVQRGTFLTWNYVTQEYYHNFIAWKDLRANQLVTEWNESYTLKALNWLAHVAYLVTGSQSCKAASQFHMMNSQITLRLWHAIQHNPRLQKALKAKHARVEFLDSWLLYKLRSGNGLETEVEHISDITSCTATGLFNPFTLNWSPLLCYICGISASILPRIVNNEAENFGHLHGGLFAHDPNWRNVNIPIGCSVSDQTAAMWGANCLHRGDMKLTLGTGAFLNVMTGSKCEAAITGLYPLVAWQLGAVANTMYCLEAAVPEFGTVMLWAQRCNFFENTSDSAGLAATVSSCNGVYFKPPPSGGSGDHSCGFIGMTDTTTRAHLVRAILESLVFRLAVICERILHAKSYDLQTIRVNGGVAQNDFICQMLADISGLQVQRAANTEASVLGAALMAGYNLQLLTNGDIANYFKTHAERVFLPADGKVAHKLQDHLKAWTKATQCSTHWP